MRTPPRLSTEMPLVSRPPLGMAATPSESHRSATDGVPEGARTVPVITPEELMLSAKLQITPSGASNSGSGSTSSWPFTHRAARYSPFRMTEPTITPASLMSVAEPPSPRSGSTTRWPSVHTAATPKTPDCNSVPTMTPSELIATAYPPCTLGSSVGCELGVCHSAGTNWTPLGRSTLTSPTITPEAFTS